MSVDKRIAIIGAGPSGTVALDTFLEYGFKNIQVFEKGPLTGGTWVTDSLLGDKTPHEDVTIYPGLETNILPELMSFSKKKVVRPAPDSPFGQLSHFKFGTAEEGFVPAEVVIEYLNSFYGEDRRKLIRFNTTVVSVEQVNGPGSRWVINGNKDDLFDFVYVAIGRFHGPYIPDIKGADDLPTEIFSHTQQYRAPVKFADKKVVVVGGSISSTDVVHFLKDYAKTPIILSTRGCLEIIAPAFRQPFIDIRPRIVELQKGTNPGTAKALFEDGTFEDNIDNIIFGTGYQFNYDFLKGYVEKHGLGGIADKGLKNFYLTTWWNEDPSLAISGLVIDGLTWRGMEYQARSTAQLWSGAPGAKLPTKEERYEWETTRRAKNIRDWHSWFPNDNLFFDELVKVGWGDVNTDGALPAYEDSWRVIYGKGFNFKKQFWENAKEEYLKQHPESVEQLNKSVSFLATRILPNPGEYGGAINQFSK